jgi:hypothetical protein
LAITWLAWRHRGLLEKEQKAGGHQAIVFGLLSGLLLTATWSIETLAPFEGWWQILRLTPAVVHGGLAYAFLAKGSGRDAARLALQTGGKSSPQALRRHKAANHSHGCITKVSLIVKESQRCKGRRPRWH